MIWFILILLIFLLWNDIALLLKLSIFFIFLSLIFSADGRLFGSLRTVRLRILIVSDFRLKGLCTLKLFKLLVIVCEWLFFVWGKLLNLTVLLNKDHLIAFLLFFQMMVPAFSLKKILFCYLFLIFFWVIVLLVVEIQVLLQ